MKGKRMAETELLDPDFSAAMLAESGNIVQQATAFIVNDAGAYERAAELMRAIKTGIDAVKQTLAPAKEQAHAAHKTIVKLEKDAVGPREQARTIYSNKRLAWQAAEERKRRAEEERLRAIELARVEDERLAEAIRLQTEGRGAQAEAVLAAPIAPPPVVLATTVPRSEGVSVRENWTMRIVNAALVPREYCIPDEKALKAIARTRRQTAVDTVPGVEFYAVKSEATSAYS